MTSRGSLALLPRGGALFRRPYYPGPSPTLRSLASLSPAFRTLFTGQIALCDRRPGWQASKAPARSFVSIQPPTTASSAAASRTVLPKAHPSVAEAAKAGVQKAEQVVDAVAPPSPAALTRWQKIKQKVKHEAHHYWHGTKLLWKEIRISASLLPKLVAGGSLTRREYRQLLRTMKDLFRLVPMLVILLIPFLEFALPIILKIFPGFLPSTYEAKQEKEKKAVQSYERRLRLSKFLRDSIKEMETAAEADKTRPLTAAQEFSTFFKKYRHSGVQAPTEDILNMTHRFQDEMTIDNLPRSQLMSMCRYMGIKAFGTDNMLRSQLRRTMVQLKADDKMIAAEGLDALSPSELKSACQARGIRTVDTPALRLRSELQQWLDLNLKHQVPFAILILSRAFMMTDKPMTTDEALQATLASLPEEVVDEAEILVAEGTAEEDPEKKLEVLEQQEDLIEEEAEQEEVGEKMEEEEEDEIKKALAKEPALEDIAKAEAELRNLTSELRLEIREAREREQERERSEEEAARKKREEST